MKLRRRLTCSLRREVLRQDARGRVGDEGKRRKRGRGGRGGQYVWGDFPWGMAHRSMYRRARRKRGGDASREDGCIDGGQGRFRDGWKEREGVRGHTGAHPVADPHHPGPPSSAFPPFLEYATGYRVGMGDFGRGDGGADRVHGIFLRISRLYFAWRHPPWRSPPLFCQTQTRSLPGSEPENPLFLKKLNHF